MNTSQNLNLPIHPRLRHPLTGKPIQALGRRADGRLIWPIMGGNGTASGDGTGGNGGTGDTGTGGDNSGQGADQGTGGTGGPDDGDKGQDGDKHASKAGADKVEDLPDWAQKTIRDLRKESGDRRTQATTAEQERTKLLDGIAQALGLKKGDDAPTPEQLAEQLKSAQTQSRQASVELAVYKAAGKHQGDPDALLDSRTFLAKVSDLDPAAKDFASKVDTAIKEAVEQNQKLKVGRAPGASSVDHGAGGTGNDGAPRKPKSLDNAVAGHYGT